MKQHRFFQQSRVGRILVWIMAWNFAALQCAPVFALPKGEQVVNGDVSFSRTAGRLLVEQATSKAIVNFNSFDIGALETVQFAQPGASAAILNRVTGGFSSEIAGALLANGNVYLINPNGILFTSSARVNVGGLVASAMQMSDSDFMNGRLFFSGAGGAVINEGHLSGKYVYLIGNQVENRGTIRAEDIVIAAGQKSVLIDEAAGGQIRLVIDGEEEPVTGEDEIAEALQDDDGAEATAEDAAQQEAAEVADEIAAASEPDSAASETTTENVIEKLVEIVEQAAADAVASAAADGSGDAGEPASATVVSDYNPGTIVNQGLIDASGEVGGSITISGYAVLQDGFITADGTEGDGGSITILAEDVIVLAPDSVTSANAGKNGDGGDVIIISKDRTHFMKGSRVEVKGGSESGDGGFAEISGKERLSFGGTVDASAPHGETGTVLFDPATLTILDADGGGGDQDVNLPMILASGTNTAINTVTWGGIEELGANANVVLSATGAVTVADVTGVASNTLNNLVQLSLSTNGSLTINSISNSITFVDVNDTIQTEGGSMTFEAYDSLTLGSLTTAGGATNTAGDVTLVATNGFISAQSVMTGGSNLVAMAGSNVTFAGDILTAGGAMSLDGGAGLLSVQGLDSGGGAMDLDAGTTIGVLGTLDSAGGNVAADAGGTITFGSTVDTGGGSLGAGSTGADLVFQAAVNTGTGAVSATAAGNIDFMSTLTTSNASVTAVAGTNLTFSGAVATGGGDVNATAAVGTVTFDQDLNTGAGSIDVTAGADALFNVSGGSLTTSSGNVTVVAGSLVDFMRDVDTGGGAIDVTGGSVQFNSVTGSLSTVGSGGDVVVNAVTNVTFFGDVATGGGNIFATSTTANVDFQRDVNSGGGALDVAAGDSISFNTVGGGVTTSNGTMTLNASTNISASGPVATGGAGLNATSTAGNITFNSTVATLGGGVDLEATAGAVDLQADVNSGGGTIDVVAGTSAGFNSTSGGLTTSNAMLTVNAGTTIDFDGIVDTGDADISATAGGTITVATNMSAGTGTIALDSSGGSVVQTGGVITADTLDLDASTGIFGTSPMQTAATTIDADSTDGNIEIANTHGSNVTANSLTTGTGDIIFLQSGGGDLDVVDATTTDGSISVTVTNGGGLTVSSSVDAGGANAVDLMADGDVDISGTVDSAGGNVTLVSDADGNSNGTMTVTEQINTGGGNFNASGYDFVMTAQGGGNDGNIDTDGGNVDILFQDTVDITASTIESGSPTNGGNIKITSINVNNEDFGITLQNVDLDSSIGSGGALSVGGGVKTQGSTSFTVGQGDIILDGGALDFIQDGGTLTFDGSAGLVSALRDVQVINGGTIETLNGFNLTITADSDGIENTDASGTAFGGVYVDGGSTLDSSGDLDITGTASLTNPTYAVLLEGTITAASNVVISGNAMTNLDVGLNGTLDSAGGFISVTSERDIMVDGTIETMGADNITLDATGNLAINNDVTSGNDVYATAGGAISSTGGTISATHVDLDAATGIGSAAAPIALAATTVDAQNSGNGEIGLSNANSVDATVTVSNLITTGNITFTQTGTADLLFPASASVNANGGDITVSSAAGLDFNNALSTAGGDLNASAGDSLDFEGITTSGGSVDASAGGDLNFNAAVSTGTGSVNAGAVSNVTFASTVTTTGGDINATSQTANVTFSGAVGTGGGTLDATAGNNLDVMGIVTTGGGEVLFDAGSTVSVAAAVNTAGGNFTATGTDFDNTGGAINTGAGATGTGGVISIVFDDTVNIAGALTSGAAGVDGGNITVIASNASASASGALTVAANISTDDGTGGTLTVSGGTTLAGGTINIGAGDVTLDGTGLDLVINNALNVDADTVLNALRDVIVNATVTTTSGGNLTIEADTDGAVNSGALGGVLVTGAGQVDSAGYAVIQGSEINDTSIAAAVGQAVYLGGSVSAADNILVEGKAAAPMGANVVIAAGSGGITSANGSVSVLSARGIVQDDNISTSGGSIDVQSQVGDITMASGASSTSGGGNIRYAGPTDVTIAVLNAGTGSVSVTAGQSILDADGATLNITASQARLVAGNAVGDLGTTDPIETSVDILASEAGAGGMTLVDVNAVTVGTVNAVTVNRVQMDGSATNLSDATALAGLTTTAGNSAIVMQTQTGTLTIDGAVTADGSGNVLLKTAGGGNIALNTNVSSSTGIITVDAAGGVQQAGDIFTGGAGTIVVGASGGNLVMQDGATATTGGGDIFYGTLGNLDVSSINAGAGIVALLGGSITDAGDTDTDVIASALFAESTSGSVGSSSNKLDTQVSTLAVLSAADIFIENTGAVTVDAVGPTAAFIVSNDGTSGFLIPLSGEDLTGANIVLTATGTITINEGGDADSLGVDATGNVLLQTMTSGNVVLNTGVQSTGGSISIVAEDNVQQNAGGSVTTSGGSIDIAANSGAITMVAGTSNSSAGGDITMMASGDVSIDLVNAGAGSIGIESTGGSIRDVGDDAAVDVIATSAALIAGNGVGDVATMEFIETSVGTIAAEGGGNGIAVEDVNAVTIGAVTVDVVRVAMGGTTSTTGVKSATGLTTLSGGGDIIAKTVSGAITVSEAVDANGSGNVLLQANGAGSGITVAADVQSGSGNISLLAANGITHTAGNIGTVGGSIDVEASTGNIAMSDGATATSGGGNIRYNAPVSILVGGINAGAGTVSLSAGNSILDNGDTDIDVSGAGVRLVATSGTVGASTNKLETAASTLAVNADNGIFIDNTGAVAIDDVGPVSVNRVQMDGTTVAVGDAALSDLVTTGNGDIVLVSSGTITVNDGTVIANGIGVNANGVGNVLLQTMGAGDINANADVVSGTGNISLLAAGSVNQAAAGDLMTAGAGTIDVEAGGSITMTNGSTAQTAGTNIRYAAGDSVAVSSLNAGAGQVSVIAGTGSITDAGDTASDIIASSARLQAGNAIGNLATMDSIDTTVNTISARAGAGGMSLEDVDAVTVGAVGPVTVQRVAMDGTVSSVTDAAQSGHATSSGGAIVQKTVNGNLTVTNAVSANGAGNVLLQAQGVGNDVAVNAAVSSGSGNISVLAPQSVTQSAAGDISTGGGDIVVTAQNGGITMSDGATATSGGGNIRYTTGLNDAILTGINAGAGGVSINSAASILDGGDTARDVAGSAVRMVSVGSIGTSANKLETSASTLAANAAAGGMFIDNQGAVAINTVGGVAADQVTMSGGVSAVQDATGLSDLASQNAGDIVLVSSGTITVNDGANPADGIGVNADTTGDVLLQTSAGNVVLNAAVQSGTGNISVLSAGGVTQASAGDITTAGAGTIDVRASGGAISMADSATAATGGGNIRYSSSGNTTLGSLNAGSGDLSVVAGGGILDGGDSAIDLIGNEARLQAGNGVGNIGAGDFLETSLDTVAVLNGAGGGVAIEDVNALVVGTVGPIGVNRVNMDGTTTPVADLALAGIASGGGNVEVTTLDGDLTVANAISAAGAGKVHLESQGATRDVHVNAAVSSTASNIIITSARDVNIAAAMTANRDVAVWADTDGNSSGDINQTAGTTEALNGNMFLAAVDINQTGATSKLKSSNGTLVVSVTNNLNLGSTLISGGVEAKSLVVGANNIIVDTLVTVAETLVFRTQNDINHSPGNTTGKLVSQSIALRAGGSIGRPGNQNVDFLRVNSDFLGTFADGDEFIIEEDDTTSAGPVLLLTDGFEYPDSGPPQAVNIPRPFEDIQEIEDLFDGIEVDDILNIIVGGDLNGGIIIARGDARILVGGSINMDKIEIGGTALLIKTGINFGPGDFNVADFDANAVDLLMVPGNANVGSFNVTSYANVMIGRSFTGNDLTVGGPFDLDVGGNWIYNTVSLGSANDVVSIGGNVDIGTLTDGGSLTLNTGGSGAIDSFNVSGNLVASFGGNLSGGSMTVRGTTVLDVGGNWTHGSVSFGSGLDTVNVRGDVDINSLSDAGSLTINVGSSGTIDDFDVNGNLVASIGGGLSGNSMTVGGTTTLGLGGDWMYNAVALAGNANLNVGGSASVTDFLAGQNLIAMVGGDWLGESFSVGGDAVLDVGGNWIYDLINVDGTLEAVVGNDIEATDFTVGDDAEITTGGDMDVVNMDIGGSLDADIDNVFTFDNLMASSVGISAGSINMGRVNTGNAQISASGDIRNNGSLITASTLSMTAGGNIGVNGPIQLNVGTIEQVSGGGSVAIVQNAAGPTPIGLLSAGGSLDVSVPNGGLVDGNGPALNLQSGLDTTVNAQFIGEAVDALEVEIGGNLFVDGAGIAGDTLESAARIFVHIDGTILGQGFSVQYIGNVAIPGFVIFNGQAVLGNELLLAQVFRTEAFVSENPAFQSSEGVFSDPVFIYLYIPVVEVGRLGIDFILAGEAEVNADPEMPPEAKRTIKIGGTERPFLR